MKKKDPVFFEIRLVFLPIQPKPLFFAQALSITGAESTNTRPSTSPISKWIYFIKAFSLSFITL